MLEEVRMEEKGGGRMLERSGVLRIECKVRRLVMEVARVARIRLGGG